MTVVKRQYRPPHTSEREFVVKNNCRLLVLTAARGVETTGEVFIRANGKPYTHGDRMVIANWLRRYAAEARGVKPNEAPGFSRPQALYAYEKAFPSGRAKPLDITMADLKDLNRDGWFISVSGSMNDVPGNSALDDYVSDYPHEIGIVPYLTNNAGPLIIEPMRPKGAGMVRASWSDVAKFSNEFATNGKRFCIGVKAGYDTKAARARRARPDTQTIERLRGIRDSLQADLVESQQRVVAQDIEIADLSLKLAECNEDQNGASDVIDDAEELYADLLATLRERYA